MKTRVVFLVVGFFLICLSAKAQRSIRIGYINMDYILENVPEYQEAQSQLNTKVTKWKGEIETKRGKIVDLKKQLDNERPLLTPELIQEREDDIRYEEDLVLAYQQKRFGPSGDLTNQKLVLIQPVQDQVFNAVQEISANRKYDFVFDKSADVVMLYAAERHDISDQVLRSITRASKRNQVNNKKEKEALERDEEKTPEEDAAVQARKDAADQKKAERQALVDERTAARDAERKKKKEEFEARRAALLEARQRRKDSILAVRQQKRDSIIAARKQNRPPAAGTDNDGGGI